MIFLKFLNLNLIFSLVEFDLIDTLIFKFHHLKFFILNYLLIFINYLYSEIIKLFHYFFFLFLIFFQTKILNTLIINNYAIFLILPISILMTNNY